MPCVLWVPRWTPRPGVCWRGRHWPEGTLWRAAMDSGRQAKCRCCKTLKTTKQYNKSTSYAELWMERDEIPVLMHLRMDEPSKTNKGQVENWQNKMISTPCERREQEESLELLKVVPCYKKDVRIGQKSWRTECTTNGCHFQGRREICGSAGTRLVHCRLPSSSGYMPIQLRDICIF